MAEYAPSWGTTLFSWTDDLMRAERTPDQIAEDVCSSGYGSFLEVDAGQHFRSFPSIEDSETAALRRVFDGSAVRPSLLGLHIDAALSPTESLGEDARVELLVPQLRAAAALGAQGVRLPLGEAGAAVLARIQPLLHELDLVLVEEIQGSNRPGDDHVRSAVDVLAGFDDPHLRLLLDASVSMPALPPTYLEALAEAGARPDLLADMSAAWGEDGARSVIGPALGQGLPPAATHMVMGSMVRFGWSDPGDWRELLPLVAGMHLKFWDLEDAENSVSRPLAAFAEGLREVGFTGVLCSEWGGHEWIDSADGTAHEFTRRHLVLAREAMEHPLDGAVAG